LNSLNAASVDTVQQALMMCSIWSYLLGSHIWGLSVHFG